MTTTLTRKIAPWGAAEIEAFTKSVRRGMKMVDIARDMGISVTSLKQKIHEHRGLYSLWLSFRNKRTMAGRQMKEHSLSPDELGGPISPELKALAQAALEAGIERRRLAAWSRAFLKACNAKADASGGVNLVEVADALGWLPKDAYRVALKLHDRGEFPYLIVTPRVPTISHESEAEITDLYATAKAAREVQLPMCHRDEFRRDTLTPDYHGPTLSRKEREDMRLTEMREDVKRYLREWKVGKRQPAYVMSESDAERCRKLAEGREDMRRRSLERRRARKVA